MPIDNAKLQKRTKNALAAIIESYGTDDGEFGATLFVTHHLEEINSTYWIQNFQTASPEPLTILNSLVLQNDFEDEDDLDSLDFTLPDNVTDYLLCVTFEDDNEISDISMES